MAPRAVLVELGAALLARDRAVFMAAATHLLEATLQRPVSEDGPPREAVCRACLFLALTASAPPGVAVRLHDSSRHGNAADIFIRFTGPAPGAVVVWIVVLSDRADARARELSAQAYAGPLIDGVKELLCCSIVVADAPPASEAPAPLAVRVRARE